MIDEMLGDTDYFAYGEGPDGPWYYKSLSVRRIDNRINVYDVDGKTAGVIWIEDLPNGREAKPALRSRLNKINQETLAEL